MSEVLRQLICDVKVITLTQEIGFSLSQFAIFSLALVVELLQSADEHGWFEQRQGWSSHHVDGQKNVSFIDKSSFVEPLVSMFSIDPNENQCGVEETQNSQFKADRNCDPGLGLPLLEFRELSHNGLKTFVQNKDQTRNESRISRNDVFTVLKRVFVADSKLLFQFFKIFLKIRFILHLRFFKTIYTGEDHQNEDE